MDLKIIKLNTIYYGKLKAFYMKNLNEFQIDIFFYGIAEFKFDKGCKSIFIF